MTLKTANDLNIRSFHRKLFHTPSSYVLYFSNMFGEVFSLVKFFIIGRLNTKGFYGFFFEIDTFHIRKCHMTPLKSGSHLSKKLTLLASMKAL